MTLAAKKKTKKKTNGKVNAEDTYKLEGEAYWKHRALTVEVAFGKEQQKRMALEIQIEKAKHQELLLLEQRQKMSFAEHARVLQEWKQFCVEFEQDVGLDLGKCSVKPGSGQVLEKDSEGEWVPIPPKRLQRLREER